MQLVQLLLKPLARFVPGDGRVADFLASLVKQWCRRQYLARGLGLRHLSPGHSLLVVSLHIPAITLVFAGAAITYLSILSLLRGHLALAIVSLGQVPEDDHLGDLWMIVIKQLGSGLL
jgi:hypothetical protein